MGSEIQPAAKVDDGGPAFPVPPDAMASDGVMCVPIQAYPGMSLRDYFAAHASSGDIDDVIAAGDFNRMRVVERRARARYVYADAMLKERATK